MEKIDKNLAKRVSVYREKAGFTVMDIVRTTSISRDMMYAYESGRRPIPLQALIEIAEKCNVSLDDLVGLKVTSTRDKAVSFDLYKSDSKGRVVLSSEFDDVIFYEVDEWNLEYFVKSSGYPLNKKVLIEEDGHYYCAIITLDEEKNLYVVNQYHENKLRVIGTREIFDKLFVLGEYAGSISKEKKIDQLF